MPSDGLRYELFDGVLVVSPAPYIRHQRASRALFLLLHEACPPDLEVFYAPVDFQPTTKRSFQPDLLMARSADLPVDDDATAITIPPLLAVEVVSKGSRSLDRIFKREMYATSGIDNYWIFDPRAVEIVVHERQGTRYVEVATAKGDQRITVDQPYPMEVCPAEIVDG
jgi:Uma2 family endonuclease